jgi:hypothetical protein
MVVLKEIVDPSEPCSAVQQKRTMTEVWKGAMKMFEYFFPRIAVPTSLYLLCRTPSISCMDARRDAVYMALAPARTSMRLPATQPRYEKEWGSPKIPAPTTAVMIW